MVAHFSLKVGAPVSILWVLLAACGLHAQEKRDNQLDLVPEVGLQNDAMPDLGASVGLTKAVQEIETLNRKSMDGFVESVIHTRGDLMGLPLRMGKACRTKPERSRQFAAAAMRVRALLDPDKGFDWKQFSEKPLLNGYDKEDGVLGRMAALVQILETEPPGVQRELVDYVGKINHAEATQALARLAIFSPATEVHVAAIDALKTRRGEDYTETLLNGIRYPWPAVAERTAAAIVRLERKDLVNRLVQFLDEADPRAPVVTWFDNRKVPVVRELVRINHHRNCLLCHAPGRDTNTVSGAVPLRDQPLPSPSQYYQFEPGVIVVRADVTYLRPDFSLMLSVTNAKPWPEMQRFDFVVRTRPIGLKEAEAYHRANKARLPGTVAPNHRAALTALRGLTGLDAAANADAWRHALSRAR